MFKQTDNTFPLLRIIMADKESFQPEETHKPAGHLSRTRKYVITGIIVSVIILIIIVVVVLKTKEGHDEPKNARERALKVLDNYPLIDGHNDLPYQLRGNYRNQLGKVLYMYLKTHS